MIALIAAAALALAPTAGTTAPAGTADDPIYNVASNDAEMNAAIARGRATLGDFYRRLADPRPGDSEFMVKFDIDPSAEGVEYVWAFSLDRTRTPMTGVLMNQPIYTKDRMGDRVAIPEDRIIDWGYRDGRVMQGNFTNRVLLGQMPAEEAAAFRAFLGW
jgi:uncharacterized protein YegJ (DUF2314 family)